MADKKIHVMRQGKRIKTPPFYSNSDYLLKFITLLVIIVLIKL
ncbi:uncharacterized protein METZ01_LOCUS398615 [marine metagenome]|uniref:Uncharacterized protein n=1 Tax=marine metagenome TaxID=408172 RepID=A0A382VIN4_9ZZZZ